MRNIRQNLVLGFAYEVAAAAMARSSVRVIANALRPHAAQVE